MTVSVCVNQTAASESPSLQFGDRIGPYVRTGLELPLWRLHTLKKVCRLDVGATYMLNDLLTYLL